MSLVLYPEEEIPTAALKVFKDETFNLSLNGYPSDRYGYTLQFFSSKAPKSMVPSQVNKLLEYARTNNLNLFNLEHGYVVPAQVYLQNGPRAKKNWSNVPFAPETWEALNDPENIKHLEERIKIWSATADQKLEGVPAGAKVDLSSVIGHLETNDPRVQIQVILDRFEQASLGVVEKTNMDHTRLSLVYKFDKEHIACSDRPDSPQSDSDISYLRSIHNFSRVAFPAKQLIDWMKNHGPQFLQTIQEANAENDETDAKKRKTT